MYLVYFLAHLQALYPGRRGSFLALSVARHAGWGVGTLRHKFEPRPASVSWRALGVQSPASCLVFEGLYSADVADPRRTTIKPQFQQLFALPLYHV